MGSSNKEGYVCDSGGGVKISESHSPFCVFAVLHGVQSSLYNLLADLGATLVLDENSISVSQLVVGSLPYVTLYAGCPSICVV